MTDDVLDQCTQDEIRYARDPRRRRDRENPRPPDASRHTPPHRREALRRAHTRNRAGDCVGGADRDAEMRRDEQRDGATRFGAEAAEGRELGEPLSHRLDDAPPAGHGAKPHGRAAGDDDPRRHYARGAAMGLGTMSGGWRNVKTM